MNGLAKLGGCAATFSLPSCNVNSLQIILMMLGRINIIFLHVG